MYFKFSTHWGAICEVWEIGARPLISRTDYWLTYLELRALGEIAELMKGLTTIEKSASLIWIYRTIPTGLLYYNLFVIRIARPPPT